MIGLQDEEAEAGHLYKHNYTKRTKTMYHGIFKKITGHNVLNPLDIQPRLLFSVQTPDTNTN